MHENGTVLDLVCVGLVCHGGEYMERCCMTRLGIVIFFSGRQKSNKNKKKTLLEG